MELSEKEIEIIQKERERQDSQSGTTWLRLTHVEKTNVLKSRIMALEHQNRRLSTMVERLSVGSTGIKAVEDGKFKERLSIQVEVWNSVDDIWLIGRNRNLLRKGSNGLVAYYKMNHNDPTERRNLGEQCRNAFEAGQCVVTYPVKE